MQMYMYIFAVGWSRKQPPQSEIESSGRTMVFCTLGVQLQVEVCFNICSSAGSCHERAGCGIMPSVLGNLSVSVAFQTSSRVHSVRKRVCFDQHNVLIHRSCVLAMVAMSMSGSILLWERQRRVY